MNRRKEGAYYENLVAEYLKTQGYEILEKNYRCRIGEIDLIAKRERHWSLWRSNIAEMIRWEIPKRQSIEKSRKKSP